jgi:hypothetical protein
MNALPKKGTIERAVLEKLSESGDEGVTFLDFTDPPISEAQLEDAIENLRTGMFEREGDDDVRATVH